MGRKAIRQLVKTYLSTVTGFKGVFEGMPKDIPQNRFPAIVITIPRQDESRATSSAPFGKKNIEYNVQLMVMHLDVSNDAVVGELYFDDLLDGIDAKLREYPQLDGSVLGAGTLYIRTEVNEGREAGKDGGNVFRTATKEFNVTAYTTG